MAYETFEKVEGIIQGINRGDSCCTMMLSVISGSDIINVVVTGETIIIDNVRLRTGRLSASVPGRADHVTAQESAGYTVLLR